MQTLLTEMARIRAHGFSEREVAIARSKLMADIESGSIAFVNRLSLCCVPCVGSLRWFVLHVPIPRVVIGCKP